MPNNHKIKVCSSCGKSEGKHWARHWKQQHPSEEIKELVPGQAPNNPFDENWLYLINNKMVQELFKTRARDTTINTPTQTINNQDQEEIKANDTQMMQLQAPSNNDNENQIEQEVIQPLEEPE